MSGPAELVALYDQLDGATLFADTMPWRVRQLDEQERVEVALPNGRTYSILRFVDLPDGTFIGLADTHPPVYVRGRADAIQPAAPPRDIVVHPRPRVSSESASDLEVVGTSLAELLATALDAGGRLDLPSQAKLLDRIPERWLR